ncbi:MAG: radical SAM family heme chaperone HemW, partial [Magnetococcus sp. YQC-5]
SHIHSVPLSLYIHIPFCVRKCPYCDFYSVAGFPVEESRYIAALIQEVSHYRTVLHEDHRPLSSLFLGGGTPSLLKGETIQTLLDGIRDHWNLTDDCEITLEANPESCIEHKPESWHRAGVNRVSLGVQAVDNTRLKLLQRPHDAKTACKAWKQLKGFERISLDLIYGTPGQRILDWQRELETVLNWGVNHLSCYALTLERDTPFYQSWMRGELRLPDEEDEMNFFLATREWLAKQGLEGYEISNFARLQQECRHNVNYWEFGDYLGIGAAAHGKWTNLNGEIWRTENPRDWSEYLSMVEQGSSARRVSAAEAGSECMLMGLRMQRGMSRARYQEITGEDLMVTHASEINLLMTKGLLSVDAKRIRLTDAGMLLGDSVMMELL